MTSIVRSFFVVFAFALAGTALGQEFSDFRGMWVSRFEYNEDSTSSIQSVINDAADMGITDIMFQVRGKADSYYNSNYEPRAEDWTSGTDPLQIALDSAHARGVKLHAWMNTMPIWRDSAQPSDPSHIFFNTNPSFLVTDINGNVEQLVGGNSTFSGSYARVNHVLPEVQAHLNNVVNDIATNYDVDGVHLLQLLDGRLPRRHPRHSDRHARFDRAGHVPAQFLGRWRQRNALPTAKGLRLDRRQRHLLQLRLDVRRLHRRSPPAGGYQLV